MNNTMLTCGLPYSPHRTGCPSSAFIIFPIRFENSNLAAKPSSPGLRLVWIGPCCLTYCSRCSWHPPEVRGCRFKPRPLVQKPVPDQMIHLDLLQCGRVATDGSYHDDKLWRVHALTFLWPNVKIILREESGCIAWQWFWSIFRNLLSTEVACKVWGE